MVEFIKLFSEIDDLDFNIAGIKGANLAHAHNLGFPVPLGFVIISKAFDFFIKESNLKDKIRAIIETIDMDDSFEILKRSDEIKKLIESQQLPKSLENEIIDAYKILSMEKIEKTGVSEDAINILRTAQEPIFVAVRSSAVCETNEDISFVGQHESFLNVKGEHNLIEAVKKCFSSLYTPRAIRYRFRKGINMDSIAVIIQKMVDAEKAGIACSFNPINDDSEIVIEAVYGLGSGITYGRIRPDFYSVSRNMEIKLIVPQDKKIAIVRNASGNNEIVKLNQERSKSTVLSNSQISEIAYQLLKLEELFKKPIEAEFAIELKKIYIIKLRIVEDAKEIRQKGKVAGKVLLEGNGVSPGIGIGNVKLIKTIDDVYKVRKGDVIVSEIIIPDIFIAIEKCNGLVSQEGGIFGPAGSLAREMQIPAVLGLDNPINLLKDGMKISVDGFAGNIYEGEVIETKTIDVKPAVPLNKVKLRIFLDNPEYSYSAASSEINSAMFNFEKITASSGGHPLFFQKENRLNEYSDIISSSIEKIAENFSIVHISTSAIKTSDYPDLEGAPSKEDNPILGLYGARFLLKYPKIFEAEINGIKKTAEKFKEKKFIVYVPFISSIEELKKIKEIFNNQKRENMDLGVIIDSPASVQIIEEISLEKIKYVLIDLEKICELTIGVDKNNKDVEDSYNELHPAIFSQLKRVIGAGIRNKFETSIIGSSVTRMEMLDFLFRKGVNYILVDAEEACDVSKILKILEDEKPKEQKESDEKKSENERIEPVDNLERIGVKASIIQEEVRDNALEQIKEDQDFENNIKIEGKVINPSED